MQVFLLLLLLRVCFVPLESLPSVVKTDAHGNSIMYGFTLTYMNIFYIQIRIVCANKGADMSLPKAMDVLISTRAFNAYVKFHTQQHEQRHNHMLIIIVMRYGSVMHACVCIRVR